MSGRLPNAWVDEVIARADIVDLVSTYLPLKRSGRNFVGLCPFHNEKTPSFSVNRENNVYHCFGCKAGGNVAQFIMEMEHLSFTDAVLYLAKQLNIPQPIAEYNPQKERERSQREKLYAINREAAQHFHDRLFSPQGSRALDYLHGRGIDDTLIRRFGLGASIDAWTDLMDALLQKGYKVEDLAQAGLVHMREERAYDVFRDRVMFPIIDRNGNTLGFGARAMGEVQPKYLNTQETQVFSKRQGVFGINLLRRQRDLKRILLVEGYMDVLALNQYGITGAVATLGTALTPEQARLMKRYAPQVWIAYDGDEAGQMAAMRALEVYEQEFIPASVLQFPDGLDPDELLRQRGAAAFEAVRPQSANGFRLGRLRKGFDLQAPESNSAYATAGCELIATVEDPIERENLLRRLVQETGYDKQVLADQVDMSRRKVRKPAQQLPKPIKPERRRLSGDRPSDNQAERQLLGLLATGYLPAGLVKVDDFETELLRDFAQMLLEGMSPARILGECEDVAAQSLASELFTPRVDVDRPGALSAAESCLHLLRTQRLDKRISEIKRQLSQMEGGEYLQSLQEIQRLSAELKQLKLS